MTSFLEAFRGEIIINIPSFMFPEHVTFHLFSMYILLCLESKVIAYF